MGTADFSQAKTGIAVSAATQTLPSSSETPEKIGFLVWMGTLERTEPYTYHDSYLSSQKPVKPSYYVPEELVEEIFLWLPPESLFRFKCVCKSWHSLITSLIKNPDFVAKHLHNSHNNIFAPKSLLISDLEENYPHGKDLLMTICSVNDGYIDYVKEEFGIPSPQGGRYLSHIEISEMMGEYLSEAHIYHCDGIVCLLCYEETMLCNLGLRESKLLPSHIEDSNEDADYEVRATGFGCDPIANDYKVVKILVDDYEDYLDYKVEIYSLKTDTWKDIWKPKGLDGHGSVGNKMAVCYKGVCYWFLDGDENMILSFDLNAEEFRAIPLPDLQVGSKPLRLVPWNDSVALVSFGGNGWMGSVEMWVMKNNFSHGVNDSFLWTNYLSNVLLPGFQVSVTIWMRDELLLQDVGGCFSSFNLRNQKLRKLIIHESDNKKLRKLIIDEPDSIVYWGPYVKSLISINRGLA